MQPALKERYHFRIATNFFAFTTVIFLILSILYAKNLLLSVAWQASISLVALFNGINAFTVRKQKLVGYFLIGLFALALYAVINTIFIGFKFSGF